MRRRALPRRRRLSMPDLAGAGAAVAGWLRGAGAGVDAGAGGRCGVSFPKRMAVAAASTPAAVPGPSTRGSHSRVRGTGARWAGRAVCCGGGVPGSGGACGCGVAGAGGCDNGGRVAWSGGVGGVGAAWGERAVRGRSWKASMPERCFGGAGAAGGGVMGPWGAAAGGCDGGAATGDWGMSASGGRHCGGGATSLLRACVCGWLRSSTARW